MLWPGAYSARCVRGSGAHGLGVGVSDKRLLGERSSDERLLYVGAGGSPSVSSRS